MPGIRKDRKADALLVIVESGAENVVRFYGRDPAKLKRSASRILRWRRTRINFVAAVFVEARRDGRLFSWDGFGWTEVTR